MMRHRSAVLATLLLVALGAPSSRAAILHVPGVFRDLQDAIDAAGAGDVIVISGGVHPPVVVDKPLAIVGKRNDRPLIRASIPGEEVSPGKQQHAITLAGPGGGVVMISGIDTGGLTDGTHYSTAGSGVFGTGFDELRIFHSTIRPSDWFVTTGIGSAAHAVSTDIPYVLVVDSTIEGGSGLEDGSVTNAIVRGAIGVRAPPSTVVVLDSHVRGGNGLDTILGLGGPCPASCDDLFGGQGGAAVVAETLYHAGSVLGGGDGAAVSCFDGVFVFPICSMPQGPVVIGASRVEALGGTLVGGGPLLEGDSWTLSWYASSPLALLAVSMVPRPPIPVSTHGPLFMDPSSMVVEVVPGNGVHAVTIPVGMTQLAWGLPIVFQVFDPATGMTRPAFGSFAPK